MVSIFFFRHAGRIQWILNVSNNSVVEGGSKGEDQGMGDESASMLEHAAVLCVWGIARHVKMRPILGTMRMVRTLVETGRKHLSRLNDGGGGSQQGGSRSSTTVVQSLQIM